MPRQGPRRPYVGVRLDPEQLEELDRRAAERTKRKTDGSKVTRSDMIRIAVDYYLGKRS